MNYCFKNISDFENPYSIFFLCGVFYNEKKSYEDKRVVLKKFLDKEGYCSLILEENFVFGNDEKKLGYNYIDLKNLNDVETLAGMIVDGIFIIHESHSTASEIALFASNDCMANKVFVLVPDIENAEEAHFSGFLSLGYQKLKKSSIEFFPITEKHIINEYHTKTFTYFNNNQIGDKLGKEILNRIYRKIKPVSLKIAKYNYNRGITNSISYYILDSKVYISIDVQFLKYYIIALFNISEFRNELRNTTGFFKGLSVCEKWFKTVLFNSIKNIERVKIKDLEDCKFIILNSINGNLNLRKAISFTLYTFHALGWIKIEPSENKGITISIKSETFAGFKSIYLKYANIIYNYHSLDLEGIL